MDIRKFIAGETLELVLELCDSEGVPIEWSELDEMVVNLTINKELVARLTKTGSELKEGDAEGEVLLSVDADDTAKWQNGLLEGVISLEMDGKVKAEVIRIYIVERANVG